MDKEFIAINELYLNQDFCTDENGNDVILKCKMIGNAYALAENAIVSMGNNMTGCSYCFFGGLADVLGLSAQERVAEIPTLYENFVFNRANPNDLTLRHTHELAYIHLTENMPPEERRNWYLSDFLRMSCADGSTYWVNHRMFALAGTANGSYWINMCVYTLDRNDIHYAQFVNTRTGECRILTNRDYSDILSSREIEVLQLIDQGLLSKEIAERLYISKNTVDRHRQHIFEKLHVGNAIEACRIAKTMGLLP